MPCQGRLQPGAYRSNFNGHTVAFDIASSGWTWTYSGNFAIGPAPSPTEGNGIFFFAEPSIAAQDCKEAAEPGVGRSVSDLVAWLEAAPGLAVSEPTPVTIGGLDGVQLDIQLDPAWKRTCFYSEEQPVVPLIFSKAEIGGYNWGIGPDMAMRWYVLGSDDGVMVVDIEDGPDGLSHDELLRTGTQIVESFESFALSPS